MYLDVTSPITSQQLVLEEVNGKTGLEDKIAFSTMESAANVAILNWNDRGTALICPMIRHTTRALEARKTVLTRVYRGHKKTPGMMPEGTPDRITRQTSRYTESAARSTKANTSTTMLAILYGGSGSGSTEADSKPGDRKILYTVGNNAAIDAFAVSFRDRIEKLGLEHPMSILRLYAMDREVGKFEKEHDGETFNSVEANVAAHNQAFSEVDRFLAAAELSANNKKSEKAKTSRARGQPQVHGGARPARRGAEADAKLPKRRPFLPERRPRIPSQ